MHFLDKLAIDKERREEFKSKKTKDFDKRIEGSIDPVVRKAIKAAIRGRYQLSIYYKGDRENKQGWRVIQPYVYGLVKGTGNHVLRAYQISGKTYSHHYPKWRLFRLDRIFNVTSNTKQIIKKAKPLYNHFGDKGMIKRILWIKFDT